MNDDRRPNIVLILVDDMGFADLGFMGSEIRTPNIDAMARDGVVLSAMYNCARCCPTRAALLTGLYPQRAGIGHMGADLGTPAYQGYLRNDAGTIAEVLRLAGYRTLMAGKWHVGGDFMPREADSWRVGDLHHPTPRQRGFDRFYGIVDGVTHSFSPHFVMEDDRRVQVPPDGYYFTDAITDKAIAMLEESVAEPAPFFLYWPTPRPTGRCTPTRRTSPATRAPIPPAGTRSAARATRKCCRAGCCSTNGQSRRATRARRPGRMSSTPIGRRAAWRSMRP